jgi:hypothetical protein
MLASQNLLAMGIGLNPDNLQMFFQINVEVNTKSPTTKLFWEEKTSPLQKLTSLAVLHGYMQTFIEPPPDTQRTERQGERGIWVAMGCYLLHVTPSLSPHLPPPPHCASVAPPAAMLSGLEGWRRAPPPPPHSPKRIMDRSWQPRLKSRMASV